MSGPCRAAKRRFHFNPASGQCEQFTYGGCPGNANRFLRQESCEAACQQFAIITTTEAVSTTELGLFLSVSSSLNFRTAISETKCARGDPIIYRESIFRHSSEEIGHQSQNSKSYTISLYIL